MVATLETGLRERAKAGRRLQITDAAADLIEAGGLGGLTMRALSEAAELSVPTIYNLIGGRDHVLVAVMERFGSEFDAQLAALESAPVDRCFEIADAMVAALTAHPDVAQAIIAEGLAPMLGERPLMRRYGAALRAAIDEAGESGDLDAEVSPNLLVEHLTAMTAGLFIRWANTDVHDDPNANRFRAAVAHGIAITLVGVADEAVAPALRRRLHAAEAPLSTTHP
jgi:AcrR family transcriptional regulator